MLAELRTFSKNAIGLWSNAGIANQHLMSIRPQKRAEYDWLKLQIIHRTTPCSEALSSLATIAPRTAFEPNSVILQMMKTNSVDPKLVKAIFQNCRHHKPGTSLLRCSVAAKSIKFLISSHDLVSISSMRVYRILLGELCIQSAACISLTILSYRTVLKAITQK